ncbi:glycosyltransferase family 2 protein [Myxococcota bacterium]|nr:glycosyltransferase family 2 protein [Myxococcota bacterium]
MDEIELSFVIPVYNGASSVGAVVEDIHDRFGDLAFEVVLVNDGSRDDSEKACLALAREHPDTVTFVHLARNFGEHGAILAGLHHAVGAYVALLDDDGQNPPGEVRRLYDEIVSGGQDVVYGRYRVKHHSRLRNWGSALNDRLANWMLDKPRDLYLSSFKVLNRFLVTEVTRYTGAFPYIDGLILRSTRNIGQIDVEHRPRDQAQSGYTLRKLFLLWLNAFLNFSITPLRVSALLGTVSSIMSLFLLALIVFDKLYINPGLTIGIPTVLLTIVFFAGVQLVILGTLGEYLGRLFLDHSKSPQFVVRYIERGGRGRD